MPTYVGFAVEGITVVLDENAGIQRHKTKIFTDILIVAGVTLPRE